MGDVRIDVGLCGEGPFARRTADSLHAPVLPGPLHLTLRLFGRPLCAEESGARRRLRPGLEYVRWSSQTAERSRPCSERIACTAHEPGGVIGALGWRV